MFRKSCELLARNGKWNPKNADVLLAQFSLTESKAKPRRNRRDFKETTALSADVDPKKQEIELLKECIQGFKEALDGIEDDWHWRR